MNVLTYPKGDHQPNQLCVGCEKPFGWRQPHLQIQAYGERRYPLHPWCADQLAETLQRAVHDMKQFTLTQQKPRP